MSTIPIRTKLGGTFVAVLLVLVFLCTYLLYISKQIHQEEIVRSSQELAQELVKRLDQRIFNLAGQLQIFARGHELQLFLTGHNMKKELFDHQSKINTVSTDEKGTSSSLATHPVSVDLRDAFIFHFESHYGYSLVTDILLTDKDGNIVAATSEREPDDLSGTQWWQQAMANGRFVGNSQQIHGNELSGTCLALRIDDGGGHFLGVMMAELDARALLRSTEVSASKYLSTKVEIVSKDGRLIYSTTPYQFGSDISDSERFRALRGEHGSFIAGDNRNTKRIYTYSHSSGYDFFEGLDWMLIISHQLKEALKPYTNLQMQILVGTLVLILLCVLATRVLDQTITSPLTRLTGAIHRLGQGDLEQRIDSGGSTEFAEVAEAFNSMLDSLEQSELEAEKSRAQYQSLFNDAQEMIHIVDTSGRIIDANPKELDLMGYSKEEYLTFNLPDLIHPDYQEVTNETLRKTLNGEKIDLYETALITKSGQTLHVEVNAVPHFENEALVSVRAIMRDISERLRMDAEREVMEHQLRQSQKMEAIGTLAGGIAHDFNNLLAAILGYTDLALDNIAKGSQPAEDLEQVKEAGYKARDLVTQILAFSRQTEIELHPIPLHTVVADAVKMLRSSIPTTVTIESEIDPDCGFVLADLTQIHQVLMNLCTNASHALEPSGGLLSIQLSRKTLESGDIRIPDDAFPGDYAELVVRDNGCGMDTTTLEKIYDPFFTTKDQGQGTGMGLSIVHGIIDQYNGRITVDSVLEVGTTFRIYLPLTDPPNTADLPGQETFESGCGHVLLVDDEQILIDMGETILKQLGYTVSAHTSPMEAFNEFKASPKRFDVVLTDQTMPALTGAELARKILGIRPDIPIVLCTGYSKMLDERTAKAIGITEFAYKPIAKSQLSSILYRVTGGTGGAEKA